MRAMKKRLLTDANGDGNGPDANGKGLRQGKKDGTGPSKQGKGKGAKLCFHCKQRPALPKRAVCAQCDKELEAWRNKRGKGKGTDKV